MSLWTSKEAAAATGGAAIGEWSAQGVSIDTRTLAHGDLFIALSAARDGHDFVASALENGAAAAMVSRIPEGLEDGAPLLLVSDVQAGLEALGRAARARTDARVVAITGSAGKTSTKEMLARILADQGRTHASVASYNNHWGVPLTLARMPRDTQFAVIEIGMNHPGEIAPLARMARPHVALITTVAAAHLEAFPDVARIAVEKASILEGLEPGGTAVLNNDIDHAAILVAKAQDLRVRDIGFGVHGFDFVLKSVQVQGDVTVAEAEAAGVSLVYRIASPGRHFASNGLGALAAAQALGADLALAAQSLGRWQPYAGRGVRERILLDAGVPGAAVDLIDDSYNANPVSMAAALAVLAEATGSDGAPMRRIAFLGDMKELGGQSTALHLALADHPNIGQIDIFHCIGKDIEALHRALPAHKRGHMLNRAEDIVPFLPNLLRPGDLVLAKGSLSMNLAAVVDGIRKMGHARPDRDTSDRG